MRIWFWFTYGTYLSIYLCYLGTYENCKRKNQQRKAKATVVKIRTMAATPQSLFRRHSRNNRDVEEGGENNDTPAVSLISGGDVNNNNIEGAPSTTNENLHASSNNDDDDDNNDDDDDDEEQELVVQVPQTNISTNNTTPTPFVLNPLIYAEPTEEATAIRRLSILTEVQRVQRANFIHFLVLCLVPTTLLIIVIIAIVSEDGECSSTNNLTVCEREARSFVNAFTSRCICDAIKSSNAAVGDVVGSDFDLGTVDADDGGV